VAQRKAGTPFPGLKLSAEDKRALEAKVAGRSRLSVRVWRRVQILKLLDKGWNLTATGEALDTYAREVRRVGWRYLDAGLEAALTDDERPKPAKKLDARQQAAVVALVCGPPPTGRARWSISLIVQEVKRRRIVAAISDETIRTLLAAHDLKPWREKNVVRA
jgi:Homeodomain-like domain